MGFNRLGTVFCISGLCGSMVFTGRESIGMLWQVEAKYNLLGGVIGAFITITVIRSMGSLGPARAVMLIVISQLAVAYLIELLGIFGVERADFSGESCWEC